MVWGCLGLPFDFSNRNAVDEGGIFHNGRFEPAGSSVVRIDVLQQGNGPLPSASLILLGEFIG